MKREQFTWYRSYYEALRTLPAKDFKVAVLAICAYALDEEVPSLSGVPNSVFTLIRPTLDSGRNKAANRLKKQKTNQEQTDNKSEQTRKEKEGENDMLKRLPPSGGNRKSPAAAAGVSPLSSAVAMVQADYLNRVNATASPASLDELAGFVEAMGPDVCRRAFDIALDERITRWSYIRGILQDKQQRGVKCLADWDALDNRRRERGGNGQRGQERKSWTDICEEMEGAT